MLLEVWRGQLHEFKLQNLIAKVQSSIAGTWAAGTGILRPGQPAVQEVLQLREQLAESRRSVEHTASHLRESQARENTLGEELAAARAGLLAAQAAAAASEAVPASVQSALDPADLEERVAAGVAAAAQGESPDSVLGWE